MSASHTKAPHNQAACARDADFLLEAAVTDLRRYCGRLGHGRIHLRVDVDGRRVIGHDLAVGTETSEDIEKTMTEPPRRGVKL
ncbi:MAG: hypothetical protein JXA57_17825 [Armatimonadetes bacterium]|nr:hypothetical protein [Armatimonadota bacterium]